MEFISKLGAMDLPDRRLRKERLEEFGIKVGVSEVDGKTPEFHYYPYKRNGKIVGYKVRLVSKKRIWSIGDCKDVDLFGWDEAIKTGARRLIIVEGELDAVALRGILLTKTKEQYKDLIPAVVSLPHGAASAKRDISKHLAKIRRNFKEVSLCFDNDEPGKRAMEEVCALEPSFTTITLPAKDANACILEGVIGQAFKAVTFKAEKPKNSRLVWGGEVHEAAKEQAEWGKSWPWEGMTEKTRGIRTGETIYIAAGEKMG